MLNRVPGLTPNKLIIAFEEFHLLPPIYKTPVYFAEHKSFGASNNEIFVLVFISWSRIIRLSRFESVNIVIISFAIDKSNFTAISSHWQKRLVNK